MIMSIAPAHSQFGGSVATRVLRCPASVGLAEKVPPHLRKASSYAERGAALHSAMALLIEEKRRIDDLVGATFNNYALTIDDVETALRPVLTYVEQLLDAPGAEFYLEQRVAFPTIPGAFGTTDLLVRIGATVYVVDFKFGAGVRVLALYPDGNEDIINGQLLFYAAAARHSFPKFFADVEDIALTILQPQSIDLDAEMISAVTVTPAELDAFITLYRAACAEALTGASRLERGAHCRFCPARPICPAHTGPLLDLARFTMPPPAAGDYLALLGAGLELVDAVKDIGKALHDQAKQALHAGSAVPGYALSAGRAVRHWQNEAAVAVTLIKLGLARDDVLVETLRSPKQVELRAKARGLKIPSEFIVSHPSGVALVRSENAHAPVPGRSALVRSFSAALWPSKEARMTKTKPDHDVDHDSHDNDNDNDADKAPVAVTPAGGLLASASLTALATALGNVDTASIIGRSGMPMLQFKRDGNGTWSFGQRRTVVEDGSRWAVNPTTFKYGYICFGDGNKVIGERLVSVFQEMPDLAELPDKGFPWKEQWGVNLKCLDGTDAGTEVIYKPTTDGGIQAVAGLLDAVRDRLNSDQHDGKVSPIVLLEKDSYPHPQYGKVWTPTLTVDDWMLLSGPAPAPKPASPPPAEQPRRRRVG